jgi:hypothetical protein
VKDKISGLYKRTCEVEILKAFLILTLWDVKIKHAASEVESQTLLMLHQNRLEAYCKKTL